MFLNPLPLGPFVDSRTGRPLKRRAPDGTASDLRSARIGSNLTSRERLFSGSFPPALSGTKTLGSDRATHRSFHCLTDVRHRWLRVLDLSIGNR